MRHLPLFVVLCSLTIFGTGTVRGEETRDQAPAPAAAAESATNAGEQSVPPAAAKPIIERSKREICDTLVQSAQSNALPIPFFIRLLLQESGFRSDVVSRAGAQGIAQFVPETARSVGLDNPFDPLQAIAASARLLRNLVTKFGNLGLAAAAYNAGPRRISDWLVRKSKLPQETQHYVKTITGRPAETWKGKRAPTAEQRSTLRAETTRELLPRRRQARPKSRPDRASWRVPARRKHPGLRLLKHQPIRPGRRWPALQSATKVEKGLSSWQQPAKRAGTKRSHSSTGRLQASVPMGWDPHRCPF